MSFLRYPKYKDSGVEWLGEVPEHWTVVGLTKYMNSVVDYRGRTPTKVETGVFLLTARNIRDGQIDYTASEEFIADDDFENVMSRGKPAIGDVVFTTEAPLGQVANLDRTDLAIAQRVIKFCGEHGVLNNYFLKYWMMGGFCQADLLRLATGSTALGIKGSKVGQVRLCMPSIDEQTIIASFLDGETAKIDELVAEQRRLIELLKEKRQAVISHAVTKGLNPNVPLRPSGIEWLGDIPEHWEVGPLKRYWSVTDCKHVTAEFVDEGIPLASIREVQSRWVDLSNAKYTTDHFYQLLIEGNRRPSPGDLIFSRNATVGEVAQVNGDHPPFAMGQDVVLLRKLESSMSTDYLQNVIRSPVIVQQLENMMIGSTFKRINVEEIRSFLLPMPTATEQQEIAAFLIGETEKFNNLTIQAEHAIELLQERRTALISAAVTGKIDVRELAGGKSS